MLADGLIQRFRQQLCPVVLKHLAEMLKRGHQSAELPQGIPPQMPLLQKLLHMTRRRTAGPRFKQPAALQQRHHRKHLRAGTQLQDREQVGQVIPQHIPRYGDGVLPGPAPGGGEPHRLHRRHYANIQPGSVVARQIFVHLLEQLRIVRPVGIQPENRSSAGQPRPIDAQPHPVLYRRVLRLAHPKNVPFRNALLHQRGARPVHHPYAPAARRLKSLVVGTVLLGGLRHQPHIRHTADSGGVEGPILLAVLNHRLVNGRVRTIRDQRNGVVQLVVRPPGAPPVPNDDRH